MNKWQVICPVVLLAVVGTVMLHQQAVADRRALTMAITQQLDAHSSGIAALLVTMSTNETSAIEDAAYGELQGVHSTSLVRRSDIRVTRTSDGILQCVLDTRRWGVPPRTIRQASPANASSPGTALKPTVTPPSDSTAPRRDK